MNDIEMIISKLISMSDNDLSLQEVKNLYLNRCKHKTRIDTYKYYKKHLKTIIQYFDNIEIKYVSQLDNKLLYRFIEFEKIKGLKNNTINKRLGTLKQALTYCEKQELITKNPMSKFDLLTKDDVETVVIDEEILQNIFEYFATEPITPQLLRSKAITYILLDTGIRLNELRQLKVDDIDLVNNQINLKYTKTNKNRTVFITNKTNEVICEYMDLVEPEDYFIININTKERMSHQGIYKFLDDIKKKLNLPSKVSLSFHKFRHTYATTCLEQGASLEFLRKTLGHSDLSTTQKYLHLSNSKLKAEHNTCTPINIYK